MQDHIFRMYDIRGIVGTELDITQVYECARAFATYALEKKPELTTVAVGMDGRLHSEAIKNEFVRGLCDSGLSVIFVGVCPTPVVSFSEYWLPVQAACMITASHNAKEYNGIKFFLDKKPVFGAELQSIKKIFKSGVYASSKTKGLCRSVALISEYVSFIKKLFPHLVGIDLPVVFDCGNGAVGALLPAVCQALELKNYTILYEEVDGNYPHHEADPSVEKNMQDLQQAVFKKAAQVGIGFDGDGDRMGAVTSTGIFVPGDKLLAVFSKALLEQMPGAKVICDTKCTTALQEVVTQCAGTLVLSPSGHAFIRKAMEDEDAVLGGELSCHFFFKDRYFGYDDGVYAALRLLELLVSSKKTLDELLKELPYRESSPELRIECKQGQGPEIVEGIHTHFVTYSGAKLTTLDGVRVELQEGWFLVRSSNTQPMISVRLESDSQEGLMHLKKNCIQALEPWYGKEFLVQALRW